MKYLIMMNHSLDEPPATAEQWTPEDMKASWACMQQIWQELAEAGELIATEKLASPHAAKIVTSDGGVPVVTDGPFAEAKEYLAGFWMVDVASEQRAIEIAARTSAAPGPGGKPSGVPIEVRPIMDAPAPEW